MCHEYCPYRHQYPETLSDGRIHHGNSIPPMTLCRSRRIEAVVYGALLLSYIDDRASKNMVQIMGERERDVALHWYPLATTSYSTSTREVQKAICDPAIKEDM